jgi:hypothetical protein
MSQGLAQLLQRARSDPQFLQQLVSDPTSATRDFNLSEQERASLAGNSAGRLGGLGDVLQAGCGSSGTCSQTCTQTCTVTFTSIADAGEVINPQVAGRGGIR